MCGQGGFFAIRVWAPDGDIWCCGEVTHAPRLPRSLDPFLPIFRCAERIACAMSEDVEQRTLTTTREGAVKDKPEAPLVSLGWESV